MCMQLPSIAKHSHFNEHWSTTDKELPRIHDREKLVPTFAGRGCHVVSVTNPYGRILGFLDRSHYYFFRVAPQLYLRG
jgi:hypothetical protein